MTDSTSSSKTQHDAWSVQVDPRLARALDVCNVQVEPLAPAAVRLRAIPLSPHFNKLRTNLLIHRAGDQVRAYVDIDLVYNGPDHIVHTALKGPSDRKWRQLCLEIRAGNVTQVVRATLESLESPVINILPPALSEINQPNTVDQPLDPGSYLACETRLVEVSELEVAFQSSVHRPLADRVAAAMTRQPPRGCVIWGPSGAGKGQMLLTTAHMLVQNGWVRSVRHLSAARLTCHRSSPADRDGALKALLDELVERPTLLLLVDRLDSGLSGTMTSLNLLAEAIDRGAHFLATVQSEDFLRSVREIPLLARRLLPIEMPSPTRNETLEILNYVARTNDCDVSPTALLTALQIAERQGMPQPAAAIELISAAMAEAAWRSQKLVTPDDVTSALSPDWPHEL